MKVGIGDFAMNLIESQLKKKGVEPIREAPAPGRDLSKVTLPMSAYEAILEQSFGLKVEKTEEPKKQVLTESKVQEVAKPTSKSPDQLLSEFQEIVIKARALLNEMTSCGMIGLGPGPIKKKKKKMKGYKYRESNG